MWRGGIDDEEYARVNGEWKFKRKSNTLLFFSTFEESWAEARIVKL